MARLSRPAITASFRRSSSIRAAPPPSDGYEVVRVRFDKLPPLAEGFEAAAKYIAATGRPLTAFCACELRSPAAFTEDGFREFNEHYVKTLSGVGHLRRHHQSGGAQQCLSGNRSAGRAIVLRFLLHAAARAMLDRASSSPAAPNRGAGQGAIPSASCATATCQPEGLQREGPLHRRRDGRAARRRSASAGRTPRPRRPTRSTTSIRVSPMNWFVSGAMRSGPDLAFCAAAGGRSRVRDGLPESDAGDGDLNRSADQPRAPLISGPRCRLRWSRDR